MVLLRICLHLCHWLSAYSVRPFDSFTRPNSYIDDNGHLASKYIHGARVDELVCMIDVAEGSAVYYYHYDGLGSIVALSNSSGNSFQSYEYSAYGQVAASDPNFTANPYLFTGRRFDYETGLYYYRARYYNPYIGRFLQTDPIGYDDGINWYAYCGNNPVGQMDPTGCWASYSHNWVKIVDSDIWVLQVLCWNDTEQTSLGTDFYFSDWGAMKYYIDNFGDFCDVSFDESAWEAWFISTSAADPFPSGASETEEDVIVYLAGGFAIAMATPIPGDEVLVGMMLGIAIGGWAINNAINGGDTIHMSRPGETLPAKSTPNSTKEETYQNQKRVRHYGPDGRATYDEHYGHDYEGAGDPHKHTWDWSKDPPGPGPAERL